MVTVVLPLAAVGVLVAVAAGAEPDVQLFALAAGLAAMVAIGVAVAVRATTGREIDELRRGRDQLRRAIARVGDALASTHDRHTIVDVVLDTAVLTMGSRGAVFWLVSGRTLRAVHESGAPEATDARLQRGEGLAGVVAKLDEPAWVPGADITLAPGEPPARVAVAVPVHTQGHLYGVLAVYGRARGGRPFTADEAETLRTFARQAEAAIDNTFLHEEASRLSITDGLTGVWNRRLFDLRCAEELDRSHRFGEPFSVVLADLDFFKQVNDRCGHQAGDAVLVELASRLKSSTREVDLVARYGGEEFGLLLSRTDLDGALRLAEKVRLAVECEPFIAGDHRLDLTLSLGVAAFPQHGQTIKELVAAADGALYRAKGSGKNRVERASNPETLEEAPT